MSYIFLWNVLNCLTRFGQCGHLFCRHVDSTVDVHQWFSFYYNEWRLSMQTTHVHHKPWFSQEFSPWTMVSQPMFDQFTPGFRPRCNPPLVRHASPGPSVRSATRRERRRFGATGATGHRFCRGAGRGQSSVTGALRSARSAGGERVVVDSAMLWRSAGLVVKQWLIDWFVRNGWWFVL